MLPPGVSERDIHASYQDGIPEIRILAGKEKPEPQKIPIIRN